MSYYEILLSPKKPNEQRLTLLRNNSWSQKKLIRLFFFFENLRLDILLSKLTDPPLEPVVLRVRTA